MTIQEQVENILREKLSELPGSTRCAWWIYEALCEADVISDKWLGNKELEVRVVKGIFRLMGHHYTTPELRDNQTVERTIYDELVKNGIVKLPQTQAT